ncbi:MAG: PAS domain S-box protein, partial [Verrucomicrobia bacterium]|nr:PAS domain S-box protein [Verrucomicrobiota bacterium]
MGARRKFRNEVRLIRPCDGRFAWLEVRGQALADEATGQKRMIGLSIDITDRKEAEAALARSEERLALSVEAADLGTFCCPMPLGNIISNAKCKELGMPGNDGYDLIQKVRSLSSVEGGGTPAVALTAFARSE